MISIVIATRNRLPQLRVALPTMQAQRDVDEVIVVDDGSTDGTSAYLHEQDVMLITLPDNDYSVNPSRAYHAGIGAAMGDTIIFSGGEIAAPDPTVVLRLCDGLDADTVHLARVYNLPVPEGAEAGKDFTVRDNWPNTMGLDKANEAVYCGHERPVPFMFLAAFRRELWTRTGGYNPTLKSGVDGEFARRARGMGVVFKGKGNVLAYHLEHKKV